MNDPSLIPEEMKAAFSKMPPIMAYRASKVLLDETDSNHLIIECLELYNETAVSRPEGRWNLSGLFLPWMGTNRHGRTECHDSGKLQSDVKRRKVQLEQCTNDLVPTIYNLKAEQTGGYFNNKGEVIAY